jgi:hypothetical protein
MSITRRRYLPRLSLSLVARSPAFSLLLTHSCTYGARDTVTRSWRTRRRTSVSSSTI